MADVQTLPSREAIVFLGTAAQAIAVFWVWKDWQMSQYQYADWRRVHKSSETQTLSNISKVWSKFGGHASVGKVDWEAIASDELENIAKEFPASSDDEELKKRKIAALTPRYGVGPSDSELTQLRQQIEYLAVHRRGVPDYRSFVRRKTFRTALNWMLVGFALQLLGSWPLQWTVQVNRAAAVVGKASPS